MQRITTFHRLALAALAAALITAPAHAAPVIEETFDYNVGALAGNNGGTGFDGAWTTSSSATTSSAEVTAGSIAFSDYVTAGNKASLHVEEIDSFSNITSARPVGVGLGSGDMWVGYLYQRTDSEAENGNGSRIASIRYEDPVIHFDSQIKGSSKQGIRVRYDGAITDPDASDDSASIQDGNAYLALIKYANLNTNDANTLATMWVLDEAGYDSVKAGGILESELDGAAVLKAVDTTNTAEVLSASDDVLHLVNATSQAPFHFDIDEYRTGAALSDVVSIPEPASAGLVLGGLALLAARRR